MIVSMLEMFQANLARETDYIESESGDAKSICNDIHIVIHCRLSLEKRWILVVDVPLKEIQ